MNVRGYVYSMSMMMHKNAGHFHTLVMDKHAYKQCENLNKLFCALREKDCM